MKVPRGFHKPSTDVSRVMRILYTLRETQGLQQMSKGMSVREKFSLEFVSVKGSAAYSGAKADLGVSALPDLFLFDEIEEAPQATITESVADESVEQLRALFGAVGANC